MTTQVLCDCSTEVIKIVVSKGRVRILRYGYKGLLSWLVGKSVFREDREIVVEGMAVRLRQQYGCAVLDDSFDMTMRAFVCAVTSCGEPKDLQPLFETIARDTVTIAAETTVPDDIGVLFKPREWQSNTSFY